MSFSTLHFTLCARKLQISSFLISNFLQRLSGSSGPCETFGNSFLAHDQEFELRTVEVISLLIPRLCTRSLL